MDLMDLIGQVLMPEKITDLSNLLVQRPAKVP